MIGFKGLNPQVQTRKYVRAFGCDVITAQLCRHAREGQTRGDTVVRQETGANTDKALYSSIRVGCQIHAKL